eukprot:jgi/Mesvir1/8959/Mv19766-RA.1
MACSMSSPHATLPAPAPNTAANPMRAEVKQRPKDGRWSTSKPLPTVPPCPFPFFDSHVHLDKICELLDERKDNPGPWTVHQLLHTQCNPYSSFAGAVHVAASSKSLPFARRLLEEMDNGGAEPPYPVWIAAGVHPCRADEYTDELEEEIAGLMKHPRVVAWGECGLDYCGPSDAIIPPEIQRDVFRRQIRRAVASNKALVVHSRDAERDTIDLLKQELPPAWPVHMHCHTSSLEMTLELLPLFPGMKFGFTGCVTFAGARADANREVVAAIPLDRLLTETDGPYMSPVPLRGAVCHPGMIPLIAETLASVKGVTLEELLCQVRLNVQAVYGV